MSIRMVTITVSEMSVGVMRDALINEGKRVHGDRLGRPSVRAVHMAEIQICLDALDNCEVQDAPKSNSPEFTVCTDPKCRNFEKVSHYEGDDDYCSLPSRTSTPMGMQQATDQGRSETLPRS